MSPEQGHAELIDARSDLYSLGVVFYEMLIGRKPYTGRPAMEVIYKHKRAELPPIEPQYAAYEPLLEAPAREIARGPFSVGARAARGRRRAQDARVSRRRHAGAARRRTLLLVADPRRAGSTGAARRRTCC